MMEKLNGNLISGVFDAEQNENKIESAEMNGVRATRDTDADEIATANVDDGDFDGTDTELGKEESGGANHQSDEPQQMSSDLREVMASLVTEAMEKMESRFREAEEAGIKRGIELARRNPSDYGIGPTMPNFLADVREGF